MFLTALDDITAALTAAEIESTTDPRAARPNIVFIEMPTFTGVSRSIADMTVILRFLAPGPGNQLSADACWKMADDLVDVFGGAITSGRPTAAIIGDQTLPGYDFTLRIVTRRPAPVEECQWQPRPFYLTRW